MTTTPPPTADPPGRPTRPGTTEPARTGLDERAVLAGWLDHHRATLLRKVDGLSDAELLTASAPPSRLTLTGLLRHMADNELWWFRVVLAGAEEAGVEWPSAAHCADPDDEDSDLFPDDGETLARVRPLFEAACADSRAVLAGLASLDALGTVRGRPVSARWVATHMVEEYARHNGHADLIREAIDGATGD